MKTEKMKIERGSGNVFADLGRPDAEAHSDKAGSVSKHKPDTLNSSELSPCPPNPPGFTGLPKSSRSRRLGCSPSRST